jgi:capsular exopolysaccharide synthesis family protein
MLAFLRHGLDRRLRGAREIEREAGLPMLGSVRKSALGKTNFGDPEGLGDDEQDLEAFRILYTNLLYMNVDDPPRRILVTSALPEEGKSTVASSLAVAAGLAGQRVLLIEADLRRPKLAEWLDLDPSPGLVDYLAGNASPPEVIRGRALAPAAGNGAGDSEQEPRVLSTIVAGKPPPRPAELLNSRRFADFTAVLSRSYDLVIFDSPPLLPVTDALDLVAHSDAVLLCVRAGKTTRDQLQAATDALRRLPERPTGYVVTGVTQETEGDYGYHRYTYGRSG